MESIASSKNRKCNSELCRDVRRKKECVVVEDEIARLAESLAIAQALLEQKKSPSYEAARQFIENKCSSLPTSIFIAGKVKKNGFRHDIVPELRGRISEDDAHNGIHWREIAYCFDFEGHSLHYTGPFPVCCDHGCYHGESQHGYGLKTGGCYFGNLTSRKFLRNQCISAIEDAHVLYAWIECDTCYGTLAEIAYAKAIKRPIVVGLSEDFDASELWFPLSMANVIIEASTAKEAFRSALPEFKKLRALYDCYRTHDTGRYPLVVSPSLNLACGKPTSLTTKPKKRGRPKFDIAEILE